MIPMPTRPRMENHLSRQEVQEALETGYGESEHYSNTMMTRMLYTAERLAGWIRHPE